ncbi:MAG TPA: GNAT family N-acetyltransferase [Clostridia bacterium]|nr:GNAT family N-acetyltransferase [Clostridia bacterium]
MEYAFEKATMADVDAVMGNIRAARGNGSADWDEDYPTSEHIAEDIANGALYVLRAPDHTIVASIAAYDDDREFEESSASAGWTMAAHSCSLFRLCVKADLQNRGLGFLIVSRIIDEARARGCEVVRLLASTDNAAPNRLYEKLNFRLLRSVYLYDWRFNAYEKQLTIEN